MSERIELEERSSAFRRRLRTFAVVNIEHIDIRDFLIDAFESYIQPIITKVIAEYTLIKVNAVFKAVFSKSIATDTGETIEKQTIYVHTKSDIVDIDTDLSDHFSGQIVTFILSKIDDIALRGSGLTLTEINEILVQINDFQPIAGSSFIDLPSSVKSKHAVVNVKNNDNRCFLYAILSALHPANKNAHRVANYIQYTNELNFNGICFPVNVRDITRFEQLNPNISINVYIYDERKHKVSTLKMTKSVKINHIHLLLLTNDDTTHYCWIKHMSRLLSSQISRNFSRKYFCDRCLNYFRDRSKLNAHTAKCVEQNEYRIEMPTEGNHIIRFKKHENQLKVPFIVYADIETMLEVPSSSFCKCSNTRAYQQHRAFSIGYYFQCTYDSTKSFYKSDRSEKCIEWFVKEMNDLAYKIAKILDNKIEMDTSIQDEFLFFLADECHICGEKYKKDDKPVRDHCHLTGAYRGSAHNHCNLKFQVSRTIPIVFHNLSHYDSHFLMRKLGGVFEGNISVIPMNDQNYISFTKTVVDSRFDDYKKFIKLRFIDSFRFMASSLDQLSKLIPSEKKVVLHRECAKRGMSAEQMSLLEQKGIFCYDYVSSSDKLNETKLPEKSEFYSKLTECAISDESYQFAQTVWGKFNIKTLGEYSDLYLLTDVLLLADVFENFRENCLNIYGLDPAHYFTAPGLSFDAMLKYTKVEIELLTDVDMLMFVENGIRGGISQCSKRYVKANNKYMVEYDESKISSYIVYLDANNLYGWSMMQNLPLDGFKWASPDHFNVNTISTIPEDSAIGYMFEVDLDYPHNLHDYHKDYPLCAENRTVPSARNEKKLLLTLYNKQNYVIHYRMLQFVLKQGLTLRKIHRVLQFNQSKWMKPYIELNTELRTKATNDFEKNFYKLLCNAIYGKTMENVRSRSDIRMKTHWDGRYGAKKLVAQPHFKRVTIFDENLIAVHMEKTDAYMDKPITVGMAILDLSKVLMADFHYNYMKTKYGNNVQIVYTGKTEHFFP